MPVFRPYQPFPRRKRAALPAMPRFRRLLQSSSSRRGAPTQRETDHGLVQLFRDAKAAEEAENQAIFSHNARLLEATQKHKHRVQEDLLDESQWYRREFFKKELGQRETDAGIQADEALTRLRQAQARKIISEPEANQWNSTIRRLEENEKLRGRMKLEEFKGDQALRFEQYKQSNRKQLEHTKAALRPPKLPKMGSFELYEQAKSVGAIGTVGDIARWGLTKKMKPEEIERFMKIEMRSAGIPFEEVFDRHAQFLRGEKEDKKAAWQELFQIPLRVPQRSPEATNAVRQYRTRFEFEKAIKDAVLAAQRAGDSEEVWKADEQLLLRQAEQAFPEEISVYHQIVGIPEFSAPTTSEVLGRMKQDLFSLFRSISSGIKTSPEEEASVNNQVQKIIEEAQRGEGSPRFRGRQ